MHKWRRAKMIRLIQAASNPALLNKSDIEFNLDPVTNVDAEVSKLIEEYTKYNEIPVKVHEACKLARNLVESGEKVIIWTSFLHNIDMIIVQLLKDLQPLHIDGRIPKDESKDYEFNREKIIRLFKNDPKFKILIATPPSCAESVSLHKNSRKETVCKNAIYLDRTFNAGQYMQSKDRIHRIGMDQDTQVMYYVFIAKGTIDEYIDQRLATKEDNMLQFLRDDFRIVDLNSREIALTEDEVNRDMKKYIDFLRKKGRI
jgi:SNF2 family DNA or RNA helicase